MRARMPDGGHVESDGQGSSKGSGVGGTSESDMTPGSRSDQGNARERKPKKLQNKSLAREDSSRSDQGSARERKPKKLQNKSLDREDSMRSGRNSDSFESFSQGEGSGFINSGREGNPIFREGSGSIVREVREGSGREGSGPGSGSGHITSGGGELASDGLPGSSRDAVGASSGGNVVKRLVLSPCGSDHEKQTFDGSVLECGVNMRRMKISSNNAPGNGTHGDSDSQEEVPEEVHMQGVIQDNVSPAMLKEIEATVRRDGKGMPTSVGSEFHADSCKACLFVFTSVGCQNGVICPFCHFKHKRGDRPRPCKGKRNRYRKLLARSEQEEQEAEEEEANRGQSGASASQAANNEEEEEQRAKKELIAL